MIQMLTAPWRALLHVWTAAVPYIVYRAWHGIDQFGGSVVATRTQVIILTILKIGPALLCAASVLTLKKRTGFLVGFLFCALGDALLQMDGRGGYPSLFVPGLAAFLIGHVCFVAGFYKMGGNKRESDATAVTLLLAAGIVYLLWDGLDPTDTVLCVALPVYAFTIATMSNRAVSLYRSLVNASAEQRLCGQCAVLGAVIFMVSDTLIAVDRFKYELGAWRNLYIEATYFTAIALISVGALVEEDGAEVEVEKRRKKIKHAHAS